MESAMKGYFGSGLLGAALLLGISTLLVGQALSQTLSVSSLNGSYGFRFVAQIVPSSNTLVTVQTSAPFAGSGVFVADGNGTITGGSITYNYNGIVCKTAVTRGTMLTGSVYVVAGDGEAGILLVLPTDNTTCGVTALFFDAALDDIGPGRLARHVQMVNTGVTAIRLETINSPIPGTLIAAVGAGEARFQEPPVLPRFQEPLDRR